MNKTTRQQFSAHQTRIYMGQLLSFLELSAKSTDQDLMGLRTKLCHDNPQLNPSTVLIMLKARRYRLRKDFLLNGNKLETHLIH